MTKLYSTLSRNFSRKDLAQAQQSADLELVREQQSKHFESKTDPIFFSMVLIKSKKEV